MILYLKLTYIKEIFISIKSLLQVTVLRKTERDVTKFALRINCLFETLRDKMIFVHGALISHLL